MRSERCHTGRSIPINCYQKIPDISDYQILSFSRFYPFIPIIFKNNLFSIESGTMIYLYKQIFSSDNCLLNVLHPGRALISLR